MATFHLQKDGKHFQVEAANREEAIAKVQGHLSGLQANTEFGQEVIDARDKPLTMHSPTIEEASAGPARDAHIAQHGTTEERVAELRSQATAPPGKLSGAPLASDDALLPHIMDTSELLAPGAKRTEDGIAMPDGRLLPEGHPDTYHPSDPRLQKQSVGSQLWDVGKTALGVADVGATMLTGAVAEPVAGLAGLAVSLTSGNDAAADVVKGLSDALTWEPKSRRGQAILGTAAVPLMKLDNSIDDFAIEASRGNPLVATAIKTALYGSMEVFGIAKLTKGQVAQARHLKTAITDAQHRLDELGIKPKQNEMFNSVVGAAEEISLTSRGEAAPAVRDALVDLRNQRKAEVDAGFEAARQRAALLKTGEVSGFARNMRDALLMDGFEVKSPVIANILEDLRQFSGKNPMTGTARPGGPKEFADLRQFEILRRRINRQIDGAANKTDRAALIKIKKGMDDFLDQQLIDDLILGDQKALGEWKNARELHARYTRDFNTDKFIMDLMDNGASPEQLTQIMLGMGQIAKPQSSMIVKRLKEVLGKDNPVIGAINQEMQFRVLEPLLEAVPNMRGFITRYDKLIRNNKSLVDELGLDTRELATLRKAADTAQHLPGSPTFAAGLDLSTVISRIIFGNKLAKSTLRVNFFRNVIRTLIGKDRISQRQILADVAGIEMKNGHILQDPNRAMTLVAPFAIAESMRLIQEGEKDRRR